MMTDKDLAREELITSAYSEYHKTGECFDGDVTRDSILSDMEEHANILLEACISKTMRHEHITNAITEYEERLQDAIEQAADDVLFDAETERRAALLGEEY